MRLFKKRIIRRDDKAAYLVRYSIFSCRWFAIKLHNILLSDHDCLHDHPWAFISFILKGGYVEHTATGSKIYHPGQLLYRRAKWAHKLEIHQPAWTLVITFRKTRMWGFFTPRGWVEYFNYRATNKCE
jgi:hypothetical protein